LQASTATTATAMNHLRGLGGGTRLSEDSRTHVRIDIQVLLDRYGVAILLDGLSAKAIFDVCDGDYEDQSQRSV
jgi:hypothetical protein